MAEGERQEGVETSVTVDVRGLSIYTHHGISEAERETGQRMVFDLTFRLDDCDATVTDRVEDTVDYAAACDVVALAATERSYNTLERLCEEVGRALLERFPAALAVGVRAAKPEPPIPTPVDEVAVEVWKERD